MDAAVQDDGVPSPPEHQPTTKRRLSRLQHMTVTKPAASPSKDQELRHKVSPASKAGFSFPLVIDEMQDDVSSQPQQFDAPPELSEVADKHSSQQQAAPAQVTSTADEDPLAVELPSTTAAAALAATPTEPTEASAAESDAAALVAAPAVNAASKPVRLQDIDLDDDDDDWEDQPAPFIPEDSIEQQGQSEAAQAAIGAAIATAGDSEVPAYDPTSRRRPQYDDEDEWEQLLQKEKHAGTQNASGGEDQQQEEEVQQDLMSGSAGTQVDSDDDGDNIMADDPDAVNASTQRMLRDMSANDCLGKGFKPQVAPLNSLLGKLAARQAALQAKAKRAPAAAHADAEAKTAAQPQLAMTLEQLKTHLEQHSLANKQQKPKQHLHQPNDEAVATTAAAAADNHQVNNTAAAAAGGHDKDVDNDNNVDIDLDVDDDLDDLEIEPPQQQQPGSNMLLPQTQELLDELHPAADAALTGTIGGTEAVAGSTAPEIDLLLRLDDAEGSNAGQEGSAHAGSAEHDRAKSGSDGEVAGSDDGEHERQEEDEDLEVTDCSEEDMLSEDEESDAEEQQQSSEIEAEPLHWEEDELQDSQQQQDGAGESGPVAAAGDKAAPKAKKSKTTVPRNRAAGGFVDAEADLSEDEEGLGLDSDEEEGSEDDAELAELIAEVQEGRMDEARRAALHAQWMHGQEDKDIRSLLEAMRKGFRRKRKQVAGLDDDDDDGNNAAARRRRAELQGILEAEGEDEPMEGTDKLQRLDLMLADDEGEAEAAAAATAAELANREKQKKIQKLQLQASESQQEDDVIQLLSMDVDEGSQHTAALLSKSASLAAAARSVGHIAGSDSNLGSLRAGAAKQGPPATVVGAAKAAGLAAGGFTFQMFGKDVTNSNQPKQVAGSFLGRQASSSVTVRAASNYGASRSYVFGSDPSNYSNVGLAGHSQPQKDDLRHAAGSSVGPSSFAGLSKLISEAAAKDSSRQGPGATSGKQQAIGSSGSSLLHMLQEKRLAVLQQLALVF